MGETPSPERRLLGQLLPLAGGPRSPGPPRLIPLPFQTAAHGASTAARRTGLLPRRGIPRTSPRRGGLTGGSWGRGLAVERYADEGERRRGGTRSRRRAARPTGRRQSARRRGSRQAVSAPPRPAVRPLPSTATPCVRSVDLTSRAMRLRRSRYSFGSTRGRAPRSGRDSGLWNPWGEGQHTVGRPGAQGGRGGVAGRGRGRIAGRPGGGLAGRSRGRIADGLGAASRGRAGLSRSP